MRPEGQLATERPLLDDSGDGMGPEAVRPARTARWRADVLEPNRSRWPRIRDGGLSPASVPSKEAEQLKLRKSTMPAAAWEAEFERLMIELARVSKAIRSDRTRRNARRELGLTTIELKSERRSLLKESQISKPSSSGPALLESDLRVLESSRVPPSTFFVLQVIPIVSTTRSAALGAARAA